MHLMDSVARPGVLWHKGRCCKRNFNKMMLLSAVRTSPPCNTCTVSDSRVVAPVQILVKWDKAHPTCHLHLGSGACLALSAMHAKLLGLRKLSEQDMVLVCSSQAPFSASLEEEKGIAMSKKKGCQDPSHHRRT